MYNLKLLILNLFENITVYDLQEGKLLTLNLLVCCLLNLYVGF